MAATIRGKTIQVHCQNPVNQESPMARMIVSAVRPMATAAFFPKSSWRGFTGRTNR